MFLGKNYHKMVGAGVYRSKNQTKNYTKSKYIDFHLLEEIKQTVFNVRTGKREEKKVAEVLEDRKTGNLYYKTIFENNGAYSINLTPLLAENGFPMRREDYKK